MRYLLQQFVIALSSLYISTLLFSGITITGGFAQYLYAALLLEIGFIILKPILNIIALPFSILFLGLFSTVTTMIVLFVIVIFNKNLQIQPFLFQGFEIYSFSVSTLHMNLFLSYVLISVTIQLIFKLISYLFDL